MKICLTDKKVNRKLSIGDVVHFANTEGTYIVANFRYASKDFYTLYEISTGYFANGTYDSIEEIENYIAQRGNNAIVYSKYEYELELVEK